MKKQTFLHLLQKKENIQNADLEKLKELEAKYPYSQMIHTLSAFGSRKLNSSESNTILTNAAVYAADRNVLKNLILSIDKPDVEVVPDKSSTKEPRQEVKSPPAKEKEDIDLTKKKSVDRIVSEPAIKKELAKSPSRSLLEPSKPIVHKSTDHPGLLSDKEAEELRADLMKNLEELLKIKNDFFGVKKDRKKKNPKKSNKGKINEPVNILTKTEPKTTATTKLMRVTKSVKKNKKPNEKSISAKTAAPKETKIRAKLNSQQEIIDKFIKADPKIRRKKEVKKEDSNNDLSKDSVSFNDDLVSENLAKVMVKQGKTSKAIDIYKKLIWKFPQKKAYFASQIESLKEK